MHNTGFLDPIFTSFYEENDNLRSTDIPFYLRMAKEADGMVLDAGCGSGRILIPLLEAGITVKGFDYSPVMLEHLSRKLEEKNLAAHVWQAGLEDANIDENKYALALCGFNTFMHLLDHAAQLSALRTMYRGLRSGGTLAFDIINPTNFDIFSSKARSRTFEATQHDMATDAQTTIWRWFERDLIAQRGVYHREYETVGNSGKSTQTTQVEFRWTYAEEMKLLLEAAGFSDAEVFGDFNDGPLDEGSEMQVWVARKI